MAYESEEYLLGIEKPETAQFHKQIFEHCSVLFPNFVFPDGKHLVFFRQETNSEPLPAV